MEEFEGNLYRRERRFLARAEQWQVIFTYYYAAGQVDL
jgi:hypothetical protein